MKIKNGIVFILISLCGLEVSAEKADTSKLTLPADTVFVRAMQYDSKTYNQFKQEKAYDYYHSKPPKGDSLWDLLRRLIEKYILSPLAGNRAANWILVAVVAVVLGLILFFFRPSWFYLNKKQKIGFGIEDEDIHALDFDRLIETALKSGRYADAIRWNYLQVLKLLHAKELISWDAHKTVIEYVYELKQPDLKSRFKEISQQFLYYRYGNFEALQEDWEQFAALTQKITKSTK